MVIDSESSPSMMQLPRLVIAAPGSGHGKTTVATGLMGALRASGMQVAGFKVGPDYIDPGYHTLATGRPGRNLDPYLCGEELMAPLLLHGAQTPVPADIAVIEGVMGLFDGQIGGNGFASTAHVAGLVDAPVILVLDISHTSRTAAAIVHGLNTFDPGIRLSGVILNKAGSERHAREITEAVQAVGFEVLGVLPRDAGIEVPSRHLGLVPAAERERGSRDGRRARATDQRSRLTDLDSFGGTVSAAARSDAMVSCNSRATTVGATSGRRRRRRPDLYLSLCRDRRVAPSCRMRTGGLRPDHRHVASGGNSRALPGRRISRGALG